MKRIAIISVVLLISTVGVAQQLPQFSQYIFNDYIINPAIAGSRPFYDVRSTHRYQWVGITDAPRTYSLSVNGPTRGKKVGLGGYLYTDIVGPTRRTGIQFSYAYHLKLKENLKLSLALSAGLLQFAVDASKITLVDNDDQAIGNGLQYDLVPDAKFSFYLYSDRYYFGATTPQIIQNKLKFFEGINSLSRLEDHYFIMGGYKLDLNNEFQFEPSFLMKYVKPVTPQFDLTGRFIYQEKLWLGASYRTQDAISAMIGYTHRQTLSFGYAYDFTTSSIRNYSSGSHEVMLGIRFVKSRPYQSEN